ncbi:MAG: methyltransferase domain-containing protein [Candidatus Kerfeldbacteria bacterium]|nr:methyltransferase domain-containing protein [Candidatus Kerfeldbacteria bacterium]
MVGGSGPVTAEFGWEQLLRCPTCGQEISLGADDWHCPKGHRGRIDQAGIVHFSERDYYYREVPRSFFSGLRVTDSPEVGRQAGREAIAALEPAARDKLISYAFDPRRGGVAILGRTGPGTTVLDFGSGWGNLTAVAARFGARVVSADMTYESLLYDSLHNNTKNVLRIRAGQHQTLPFGDAVFDTIFLNGVLEWLPEGYRLNQDPKTVQITYLQEFRRLLAPGGILVVAIENRHSFAYWLGRREDHTGLRYGALLPRWSANLYSRLVRRRPYRTYTYTQSGYRLLFQAGGFADPVFHIPLPRYRYWNRIIPEKKLSTARLFQSGGQPGAKNWVARTMIRQLQGRGWLKHFVQDYIIATSKLEAPQSSLLDSTLASIMKSAGERLDDVDELRVSSTQTLHFSGHRWFYKVPLTDAAAERLRREIDALVTLRDSDLQNLIVPEAQWETGPDRAVYTKLVGRSPQRQAAVDEQLVADVLRRLSRSDRLVPLGETDAYRRWVTALQQNQMPDWINAQRVLKQLETWQGQEVRAGIVHGDFVWQNIIIQPGGQVTVVDWDRYEPQSPRFLDSRASSIEKHDVGADRMSAPKFSSLPTKVEYLFFLFDRIVKDVSAYAHPIYMAHVWHKKRKTEWDRAWNEVQKNQRPKPLG